MQVLAWIFLGVIALGATYVGLTRPEDDELMLIATAVAALAWLLFAFYALDVTIYDSTGTQQTDRYPAMAVFGLAMAAPNVYVLLTGPLEVVKRRSRFREELR